MSPRTTLFRRQSIIDLAAANGSMSVDDLASRFGVSRSTIRRDLALLSQSGKLTRTFGGAMASPHHREASLRQRIGEAYEAKRAIARWARTRIGPGDTILLDAGSSVGALAHELRDAENLHVVTMSLTAIDELAESPGLDVDCLGGRLRPLSQGFVGPLTESALERFTFDSVFLGADGVDATRGICEADLEQTRLKELICRRAERIYVLAHAEKVGASPFYAWARLERPWTLITDSSVTEYQLEPFRDAGVETIVVPLDAD